MLLLHPLYSMSYLMASSNFLLLCPSSPLSLFLLYPSILLSPPPLSVLLPSFSSPFSLLTPSFFLISIFPKVMWPIFHNVDQLDSIHAAWRLKKSSTVTKKVSGIASVTNQIESSTPPTVFSAPALSSQVTTAFETVEGAEEKQRTVRWNHGGKGECSVVLCSRVQCHVVECSVIR